MDNKTRVFDAQQEIAELKRRVAYLENLDPNYGKAVAYASGCQDVPHDAYKINLPNCVASPELIDKLKEMSAYFKENKLD